MPPAPEIIMPELEAPTEGTYQELLEGHDWETHLPPSPEGRLVRTADYCTGCGASVHFLLRPEAATILAARFTLPDRQTHRLFLLEADRMEPRTPQACHHALQQLNPGLTWSVPVDPDGQVRREDKYRPLKPELAPAFPDLLRQHRWEQQQDGARAGEYLHQCRVCQARMHVYPSQSARIDQVRVRLPASRECHYRSARNAVIPVTDADFYGREPLRLTQEQLDAELPRQPAGRTAPTAPKPAAKPTPHQTRRM